MMGSRALSHDSIFLADQVLTEVEPVRILSQENVHSKIKALQLKLQQQNLHLGPPPLVLPIKRSEVLESGCQDDSLPHSPRKNSGTDIGASPTFTKTIYQPLPLPFLLTPKLPLTKSVSQPPSHPSVISNSTTSEPPLDFSSPAEFIPCLDTSAARHRVSIKPRNQRASTKKRVLTGESESHLPTQNNAERPESVQEEDVVAQETVLFDTDQKEEDQPVASQCLSTKFPDEPNSPSKSSSLTQQDQALLGGLPSAPPPVLRVKLQRPADNTDTRRPHSSFIPSELKNIREGMSEIPPVLCDKSNTESSSKGPSEPAPSTREIKRPSPGSGSCHFSITTARYRDVERPRSGSFVGVLEQARCRIENRTCSSMKEKPEFKELRQKGGPFPGGAPDKSSALLWDRRDSQQKMELASSFPSVTTETAVAAEEEEEEEEEEAVRSQKMLKEAMEVQETGKDEVKTAFGVKLRCTSQSMRLRSSNYITNPAALSAEQRDDPKSHMTEKSDTSSLVSWKPPTAKDHQVSDPAPPGRPVRNNLPVTCDPPITPKDLHVTSSKLKEAETCPQEPQPTAPTAPPEVSWMSLAMEKTRSLQQLFAGRFPRDLTGVQARPQTHVHVMNTTEAPAGEQLQTSSTSHDATNHPSMEAGQAETQQSRNSAQAVKPKMSPLLAADQQTNKCHSQPNTAQPTSQPASVWAHPHTTPSPLSSVQAETSPQSAQTSVAQSLAQFYLSSGQKQHPSPTWSDRGQVTSKCPSAPASASASSSVRASPLVSASVRGEKEESMQEKGNASVSGRQAIWSGSVGMKAAFLEKQAQWTCGHSGTKTVDIKKASAEGQMSEESMASTKTTHLNKDIDSKEGQGLKPADSSPIKVPERTCEDKWLRKNVLSSPLNSPSPAVPPAFQSASDSSQPSWMELAKRKSMAWTDKSMD
ncbi:cancer-related regulator of actin dynamics isoform X2 [Takifugu rubripes]|nr:uncharacterized protein KIAA1211-like homolog isoform X2 [Takifugu rubripes]